jgi:hypothetical protein
MANDPPDFDERFSKLMNSLQRAALLAGKRAADARLDAAEADALSRAVHDAVDAARSLRPGLAQ